MSKEAMELMLSRSIIELLSGGGSAKEPGTSSGGTGEAAPAEKPVDETDPLLTIWFALCRAGVEKARKFIELQSETK